MPLSPPPVVFSAPVSRTAHRGAVCAGEIFGAKESEIAVTSHFPSDGAENPFSGDHRTYLCKDTESDKLNIVFSVVRTPE
jgi:hypothetical protein